jgi:hypothetical protein
VTIKKKDYYRTRCCKLLGGSLLTEELNYFVLLRDLMRKNKNVFLSVVPKYLNVKSVTEFIYFGTTLTNQNDIHDDVKSRLNSGNCCYYSVQDLLSSSLISKNLKIEI